MTRMGGVYYKTEIHIYMVRAGLNIKKKTVFAYLNQYGT